MSVTSRSLKLTEVSGFTLPMLWNGFIKTAHFALPAAMFNAGPQSRELVKHSWVPICSFLTESCSANDLAIFYATKTNQLGQGRKSPQASP